MLEHLPDRIAPRNDLKKIERRLPEYARTALRRIRSDARSADALSEGKWKQTVADGEKRMALRIDAERAESYLRRTRDSYPEYIKEAGAALIEAQTALAEFDAERETRKQKLQEMQRATEGNHLDRCLRFLTANEHAKFYERIAPAPTGDLRKHLVKIRAEIDGKRGEIESIDLAPLTLNDATAAIDADIAKLVASGPDIYGVTRYEGTNARTRRQGAIRWPEAWTGTGGRRVPDGLAALAWLFPDALREKLVNDADERIKKSAFTPIAISDREPMRMRLHAELLDMERIEEATVFALQSANDTTAIRRHDADPRAVLGIEVEQAKREAHGAGSLADPVEIPKMETPPDAKLVRSSKWTSQGPRLSDTVTD
ncbi:MAG: hypothetical protein J0H40_04030 [Rhizobiales bacterium]|nr:hypothetical protein [Hyphomicrobiales bacterium]